MKKIIATIIKEWLLMKRDFAGLLLLLVMPAILIVVMALIQDAPFKDYQEVRFDLLLADNDHGILATQIKNGLRQSKNFHVTDSIGGQELSEQQLKNMLQDGSGNYKIGIVIPKGVTAEVVNSANIIVNSMSGKMGMNASLPVRAARDQIFVQMYFDPVSMPSFRASISNALDKFITYACSNVLVDRLSLLSGQKADTSAKTNPDLKKILQGVGIKEEPLNDKESYKQHINSVQHNVPAWAIFGMFFIVIPLAGHMIREREEGSALRIALVPNVYKSVAMGKIIFYTLICTLQFFIMFGIGLWVMPLLGLPSIYLGTHPVLLLPIAICIGFAATTYGYLIGAIFKTVNQALPFGSISIVILSAMGGVWVPIDLLSKTMQHVAMVSPLHWGLTAVNNVILRDGSVKDVLLPLTVLTCLGVVMWLISIFLNSRRYQSVQ